MEKYLIYIGLILNSLLIVIKRYVKPIPDSIYIALMILGIGLMIVGAFLLK